MSPYPQSYAEPSLGAAGGYAARIDCNSVKTSWREHELRQLYGLNAVGRPIATGG